MLAESNENVDPEISTDEGRPDERGEEVKLRPETASPVVELLKMHPTIVAWKTPVIATLGRAPWP